MSDDRLHLRASALAAQAEAKIIAELGPRARPNFAPDRQPEEGETITIDLSEERQHPGMPRSSPMFDAYLANAERIASEVIGPEWEFRISLTAQGEPRIFIEQYVGSQIDRRPLEWSGER